LRDLKVAILLFNLHNKYFKDLLIKVEKGISKHPKFIKIVKKNINEWECVFKSNFSIDDMMTITFIISNYFN
jgi:hypothetical protein